MVILILLAKVSHVTMPESHRVGSWTPAGKDGQRMGWPSKRFRGAQMRKGPYTFSFTTSAPSLALKKLRLSEDKGLAKLPQ